MTSYTISIKCGPYRGQTSGDIENVDIETNLHQFAAMGWSVESTQEVVVDVHYHANPFPGLQAVNAWMRKQANEWRDVSTLKLTLHPATTPTKKRDCNVSIYDVAIGDCCCALAALMPEVRELDFGGKKKNYLAGPLFGRLAALYANQLQVLHSTHPVIAPSDCRFAQLKVVRICKGNYRGYQLPRMDPAAIESLVLLGFHAEHSWSAFANSSEDKEIEFPSLRSLAVSYVPPLEGDVIGQQHTLRFPVLEYLDASSSDMTLPLLLHASIPVRLNALTISARAEVYPAIARATLPETNHLQLQIRGASAGNTEALDCARQMLFATQRCLNKELFVDDASIPVVARHVYHVSLTSLRVAAPTSVDQVIEIIQMCPRLTKLTINNLTLGDIKADLSLPSHDDDNLPGPLGAPLEYLEINASEIDGHNAQLTAVAKFLIRRTGSLEIFCSNNYKYQDMQDIFDEEEWLPGRPYAIEFWSGYRAASEQGQA
ncbi:hypothetical protein H4R19_000717 [Coemansia spiralis]|nr:hypothetical protein H4R19_000717 [Coemansia spiralis]